ncbi:MAG TPA: D-sedoheptulose 7-phosphate isomerase [Candidatus Thermoplasmatota archaeon]|nr:D-sedoheptulose 7-phosphate isomerase [Candidatus Thermoplasmatota archaeon]
MASEADVLAQIQASIDAKEGLKASARQILAVADVVTRSLRNGGKMIIFGNGGSAADAQHIAAELSGQFYNRKRPGAAALAITTNTSALTAIANDFDFETVFSRQLEGLTRPGDVVIGISTSGNSPNVVKAMETARKLGAVTVAMTGAGGKLAGMVDHALVVPSTETPRIQESHILMGHILCQIVEKDLFG